MTKFGTANAVSVKKIRKNRSQKMNKEEAFQKIREHIEMLAQYNLIDERVASTLTGYIYDYIDEIRTVTPKTLDTKYFEQFWKSDWGKLTPPPSDEPWDNNDTQPPTTED